MDYIWHAPVAPQNLKFDALGSDPRAPVRIDRILSWGPVNEAWLKRTGARVGELLTVGNPVLGKYCNRKASCPNLEAGSERRSALVVQQTTVFTDLSAGLSRQFYQFIHATRELKRQGYKRVTFKLHPGIQRGVEIFSAIKNAFDLDCDIHRYGKIRSFRSRGRCYRRTFGFRFRAGNRELREQIYPGISASNQSGRDLLFRNRAYPVPARRYWTGTVRKPLSR